MHVCGVRGMTPRTGGAEKVTDRGFPGVFNSPVSWYGGKAGLSLCAKGPAGMATEGELGGFWQVRQVISLAAVLSNVGT